MHYMHLYAKLLVYVLCQMLCAIYAAVLASCAAEAEHERCEAALDVAADMCVGQLIHAVEEGEYLAVVFKKAYDGLVQSCQFLVRLVASGVVSE